MGLDITVHRIKKYDKEDDNYFRLDRNREEYPLWVYDFESERESQYYDWKLWEKMNNIDISKMYHLCTEYSDKGNFLYLGKSPDDKYWEGDCLKIDLDTVPIYTKIDKVLGYDEIGYQRKGLNGKFYEDYKNGINKYFVFDKYTLERYKRDYCDTEDDKERFQENIIDVFEEGKDIVSFDW